MAGDGTAVQRKPQCILVGRIKHMTPQLAVQHTTVRLTVLLRQVNAEGLLLRSLCFLDNVKCCKLGHFYHFCQAFGGGHGPLGHPPLEPQ